MTDPGAPARDAPPSGQRAASPHAPAPHPGTSLVGRAKEIADLQALLSEHRLVTLTGAGGAGKTRLAVEVARSLAEDGHKSTFVDIAALDSADVVPAAMLSPLGLRATADQTPVDLMADSIGSGGHSMVLDNFEHVTAAAPLIGELLDRCPGLTVLVTSRRRLRLIAGREVRRLAGRVLHSRVDQGRRGHGRGRGRAVEPRDSRFHRRASAVDPQARGRHDQSFRSSAACRRRAVP